MISGMKTKSLLYSFCAAALAFSAGAAELDKTKTVWAHYVPWNSPQNNAMLPTLLYNYPLGAQADTSREALNAEFRQAKAQGIDGFLVDIVSYKNRETAFLGVIKGMLDATGDTGFLVAPCLDGKNSHEAIVKDLKTILDACASHPNYPHMNGRPVIATYAWGARTPEEWIRIKEDLRKQGHDIYLIANLSSGYQKKDPAKLAAAAEAFDMAYSFMENGIDGRTIKENIALMWNAAKSKNRALMGSLWPGYYGAWIHGRNDYYHPHIGFDQLHDTFEAMEAGRETWMHFTTWNDHDETSIMPMLFTWGNAGITKAYSDSFKGRAPSTKVPQIYFAWHREEIAGTVLRLEAMSVPSALKGKTSVSGVLRGLNGKIVSRLPVRELDPAAYSRAEWLIPTAPLAENPFLIPEITLTGPGSYRAKRSLPMILLKTGWLQNAVTVKVPFQGMTDFKNTLSISEKNHVLKAEITFDSPETIREAILFRNDKPLAAFSKDAVEGILLNLATDFTKSCNYKLVFKDAKLLRSRRMFTDPNDPLFQVTPTEVISKRNLTYHQGAFLFAVRPSSEIRFEVSGKKPLLIRAEQFAEHGQIRSGDAVLYLPGSSSVTALSPALNRKQGTETLRLLSRAARADDLFYVRYETTDGKVCYSEPILPFAEGKNVTMNLLNTSVNLETSSGGSGMPGRSEYLTPIAKVPFRKPSVTGNSVHPAVVRKSRWTFENGGEDSLGDMNIRTTRYAWFDPGVVVAGGHNGGMCLKFNGRKTLRMPMRTYPLTAFTLDFYIKPEGPRKQRQAVITRRGWSGGVDVFLLPDGKLELVRNGNESTPKETLLSRTSIPEKRWTNIRIVHDESSLELYLDGKLDAKRTIVPARSYGNCTWFLGGNGKANFTGLLDDVTILGIPARPGSPLYPPLPAPEKRSDIADLYGTTLKAVPEKRSCRWTADENADLLPGDPRKVGVATEAAVRAKAVFGTEGGVALQAGPGKSQRGVTVSSSLQLKDREELVIPLLRYEIARKGLGWTALIVTLTGKSGQGYSFNLGAPDRMMITQNKPAWKILSGTKKVELPLELAFRRINGQIVLLANGKVVKVLPDEGLDHLTIHASLQNSGNAIAAEFGAPRISVLR